ncbi:hypothetical protein BESB_018380 [Besnoitia besnoiti]|uniref:Spindle assembly abnormal protein 6 N-terminal domain-containing protein n=1 Tax=Besnoitia besnoiti TaxID=94643 RepID=A0A2A9MAW8_BESBE|nr:hypothetical protein BESB_018380 [Besnoitia besnoiti]PFH32520.1 hypothetical protein BESB_018380 [Besnoitia besnoiti]
MPYPTAPFAAEPPGGGALSPASAFPPPFFPPSPPSLSSTASSPALPSAASLWRTRSLSAGPGERAEAAAPAARGAPPAAGEAAARRGSCAGASEKRSEEEEQRVGALGPATELYFRLKKKGYFGGDRSGPPAGFDHLALSAGALTPGVDDSSCPRSASLPSQASDSLQRSPDQARDEAPAPCACAPLRNPASFSATATPGAHLKADSMQSGCGGPAASVSSSWPQAAGGLPPSASCSSCASCAAAAAPAASRCWSGALNVKLEAKAPRGAGDVHQSVSPSSKENLLPSLCAAARPASPFLPLFAAGSRASQLGWPPQGSAERLHAALPSAHALAPLSLHARPAGLVGWDGGRAGGSREEILFFRELPVKVKSGSDRDSFVCPLTLKLSVSGGSQGTGFQQVLRVELTDRQNLFVHYSAEVGETDFSRMRSEQRLLIDFQAFPAKFVELLEECAFCPASEGSAQRLAAIFTCPGFCGSSVPAASSFPPEGAGDGRKAPFFSDFPRNGENCSPGKMSAVATAGGEAWLSLVELNLFKELTHLSLRLRKSSDDTLKLHLAQQLAAFQDFSSAKMEEVALLQKQRAHLQEQLAGLANLFEASQAETARLFEETKEKHEESLKKALAAQGAEAEEVLRRLGAEQREREEKHAIEKEEIKQKVEKSEQELLLASGRTAALEAELKELRAAYEDAKSQVGRVVWRCGEVEGRERQEREGRCLLEQRADELKEEVTKLKERDAASATILKERETLLSELQEQKVALQERLKQQKEREGQLEEELNTAIQEIHRGNEIIAKLQQQIRTFKAKQKARSADCQALEKDVAALTLKSASLQQQLEHQRAEERQKAEQAAALAQQCEHLCQEISQLQEELAAAKDVNLRLNKELTTRQLETYMSRYSSARGPSAAASAFSSFSAAPTRSFGQGGAPGERDGAARSHEEAAVFASIPTSVAAQSTLSALSRISRADDGATGSFDAAKKTDARLSGGLGWPSPSPRTLLASVEKREDSEDAQADAEGAPHARPTGVSGPGARGDTLSPRSLAPAPPQGDTFADRLRATSSAAAPRH